MPNNVFSYIKKAFSFESGALFLLSLLPAWGTKEFLILMLNDVNMKRLLLPLSIFGVLTMLYCLVSIGDFHTGLRASKYEHFLNTGQTKNYIKTDKLYQSIWKFLGVMIIGSILTVFAMMFAVAEIDTLNSSFIVGQFIFFFVVITFDINSISNNHLRRYGKKPLYYGFIDDVAKAVRVGIISNIGKWIARMMRVDSNYESNYPYNIKENTEDSEPKNDEKNNDTRN